MGFYDTHFKRIDGEAIGNMRYRLGSRAKLNHHPLRGLI